MKTIILGAVIGILLGISGSVIADSYGYGAYGGVNSVVMPMLYQAAINNANEKAKEEPVKVDPSAPLSYRFFNSGREYEVIKKFVDPDNGNVCYIWSVNEYAGLGGISCVK